CSHALLEHGIRRIPDASVDIPRDFQVEKSRPVIRAIEFERNGLIDRYGHRFRSGVPVKACVNSKCFEPHMFVRATSLLCPEHCLWAKSGFRPYSRAPTSELQIRSMSTSCTSGFVALIACPNLAAFATVCVKLRAAKSAPKVKRITGP